MLKTFIHNLVKLYASHSQYINQYIMVRQRTAGCHLCTLVHYSGARFLNISLLSLFFMLHLLLFCFMLQLPHVALLHFFTRVALFLSCTFSYCNLFKLHLFLCFVLHSFRVALFRVALFSYCVLFTLHIFCVVHFSCCTFPCCTFLFSC